MSHLLSTGKVWEGARPSGQSADLPVGERRSREDAPPPRGGPAATQGRTPPGEPSEEPREEPRRRKRLRGDTPEEEVSGEEEQAENPHVEAAVPGPPLAGASGGAATGARGASASSGTAAPVGGKRRRPRSAADLASRQRRDLARDPADREARRARGREGGESG